MNTLPKEIEDIILDYKKDLEVHKNYKKCLNEINKMYYIIKETIEDDYLYHISIRHMNNNMVRYIKDDSYMKEKLEFNEINSNYLKYTNRKGTYVCYGNDFSFYYYPDGVGGIGINRIYKVYEYCRYEIEEVYEDVYNLY